MRDLISIVEAAGTPNISDIIANLRAAYNARGISDRDIGNGWCGDFAGDVMEQLFGTEEWQRLENENCMTVETGNFCLSDDGFPSGWDPRVLQNFHVIVPAGVNKKVFDDVGLDCPHHVWVFYNGKHYDAESPKGEASFLSLKFFQRHLGLLTS